jgi:hypothetical protein
LLLSIEPEAILLPLEKDEEVTVHDPFIEKPVTITVTSTGSGETVLSIWPGDGVVRVCKDGVDVFDLFDRAACPQPFPT